MKLNSYDEWSPLKEVILGSATNYTSHARELSFDLFFHDYVHRSAAYPRLSPPGDREPTCASTSAHAAINQIYVDELNEDLDGMEKV
jgi:glycine amidinotransferase